MLTEQNVPFLWIITYQDPIQWCLSSRRPQMFYKCQVKCDIMELKTTNGKETGNYNQNENQVFLSESMRTSLQKHMGVMSAWFVRSSYLTFYQQRWQKGRMSPIHNLTLSGQRVDWVPSTPMKFPSAGSEMGGRDWCKGRVGASMNPCLLSASSLQFGLKDTLKDYRQPLIQRLWLQNAIRGWPCPRGWLSRSLLHSHTSWFGQAVRHNYFLISPS